MKLLKPAFIPKLIMAFFVLVELALIVIGYLYVADLLVVSEADPNLVLFIFAGIIVVNILCSIYIINSTVSDAYKITWLFFVNALPLIGFIFYLIFANKQTSRSQRRKYIKWSRNIQKEDADPAVLEMVKEDLPGSAPLIRYLASVSGSGIYRDTSVEYFSLGDYAFPKMLEELKKAKHYIFMEFFIVTDGKWWKAIHEVLKQKAAEGVEVRFVYDDFGSGAGLPDKFIKTLWSEGIHVYPFHPISFLLNRTINNRDHRKIVVVDHQCAFTGGMNLADEYANDKLRFGYWKDTMVKIEGKGIRDLAGIFLENYDLASESVSDYSAFLDGDDYPHFEEPGYCFSFGDGPGPYTKHEQIGEQNYINLLSTATKQADICTPYLICSYPLQRAVLAAAKRGVRVNLIVPGIPDKKMVYKMAQCQFGIFLKAGVHIYVYTPGFNHEKQMLIDDRICFCGTINFDFRSLTHHFEDGMVFLDTPCMKEVRADFDEMMSQSQEVPVDFKVPTGQRLICALLKIFRVLL